jgi:hypothetical protein
MASGHVNRIKRPDTWLHRPSLLREESPCQSGAVHTWHKCDVLTGLRNVRFQELSDLLTLSSSQFDRCCRKKPRHNWLCYWEAIPAYSRSGVAA